MNHADIFVCSTVGVLGAVLYARGRKPLLKLQRGITLLRAAGYMLEEMADGAKSRLYRWPECKGKAEREV